MTWNWKAQTLWQKLLVGLLFVAAASGFRAVFFGELGRGIPYLLFFPALTLAALYGGLSAGLLATALSTALTFLWVLQRELSPIEYMALAIFAISGTLISFVCEMMLRANAKAKRAEAGLRQSNDYLDNLLNYANAPIVVWDSSFKITRLNQAFEALTGRAAGETLGKSMELLFPPPLVESAMALIQKTISGERWESVEIDILHVDGSRRTVLWNSATLFEADGKTPMATIAHGQDITARKQAEQDLQESEERFRTMANSMPQLAWIARADGYIYWYNLRWYEYTGTTPAQMEGWGWQSVHDPELLPRVMATWTGAIADGQPFEMEFPLRGADGKFRAFLTRGQPLRDAKGKVAQWFGTNTDVEALKQAEEMVRRLNADLEQRVIERTAQLEAANKELESFSYSVSHDLRAPLRAVNGFAKILLDTCAPQLTAEARELLAYIRTGGEQMGQLIDDLLAFSRLGRQALKSQPVDTALLVQTVLDDLAPQREGRPFEIKIGELPGCQGDQALLKQVWLNLVSNAIKYTRGRTPSVVEIGSDHSASEVVFYVRDNGAGFDMRYAHKLFGVFQRLHRADEFEGTGVGLAIVQRIIHRHGGRVWAEAELGRGATFNFTLGLENGS